MEEARKKPKQYDSIHADVCCKSAEILCGVVINRCVISLEKVLVYKKIGSADFELKAIVEDKEGSRAFDAELGMLIEARLVCFDQVTKQWHHHGDVTYPICLQRWEAESTQRTAETCKVPTYSIDLRHFNETPFLWATCDQLPSYRFGAQFDGEFMINLYWNFEISGVSTTVLRLSPRMDSESPRYYWLDLGSEFSSRYRQIHGPQWKLWRSRYGEVLKAFELHKKTIEMPSGKRESVYVQDPNNMVALKISKFLAPLPRTGQLTTKTIPGFNNVHMGYNENILNEIEAYVYLQRNMSICPSLVSSLSSAEADAGEGVLVRRSLPSAARPSTGAGAAQSRRYKYNATAATTTVPIVTNMDLFAHFKGACADSENLYVATEFYVEKSVLDYMVKPRMGMQSLGRLSDRDCRTLLKHLVRAIQFLHDHGMVHQDISLENVFIEYLNPETGTLGAVRLSDFGMYAAVPFGHNEGAFLRLPPRQKCVGKPYYHCPELSKPLASSDESIGYDGFKVDIWQLGILVYIALTGNGPFECDDFEINRDAWFQTLEEGRLGIHVVPRWREFDENNYVQSRALSLENCISSSALDFLKNLLKVNPNERFDLSQVRTHPWISGNDV